MISTGRVVASAVVAALALAAGIGAGCGSSGTTSGAGGTTLSATPDINVSIDQKAASELPADVKSKGTLVVAADATYAPDEFIAPDGHTIIGMDADLAKALGQALGLKTEMKNVTFDAILPGLAANKYDLGMSSFTITKEREKTVDFVSYAQAGTSFYVKADGGPEIGSLADLCGHTVAVERGTIQQSDATAQDKKCKAQGKPGVTVSVFPDQNGANLAISSGRAEVGMADSPVAAYIVEQSNGQFKLSGEPYAVALYGIALPKDSGLAQPVLDALKAVIADGTYKRIFDYWNLDQSTIESPKINPTNVPAS